MILFRILICTAMALMCGSLQANELDYSVSASGGAFSHLIWRGNDLNNSGSVTLGGVDVKHNSRTYAEVPAKPYDSGRLRGAEINAYVGYSVAATERLDINFAVTNYQYTGVTIDTIDTSDITDSSDSTELKIGVTYDIATINLHHEIDLKSTYFEVNVSHNLHALFSINTHVGMNDSGRENFFDYAISGEYAASDILSVTLGYANHELDSVHTGSQVFAGASLSF